MDQPGRILIVDDDLEARELLHELLVDEGYAVEMASDGASALAKLNGFAADLVVTDYEMPGMSGIELIRVLQARNPGQPTLLVTARSACELPRGGEELGGPVVCMQKPLDLDDLMLIVHRLIDGGPRPATAH
jgi:two-component system, OmpR family, response regulator MprA